MFSIFISVRCLPNGCLQTDCRITNANCQKLDVLFDFRDIVYIKDGDIEQGYDLEDTIRKNNCGLIFGLNEKSFFLANDKFGTYPMYMYKGKDIIYLFNRFVSLMDMNKIDLSIDQIGFWETLIYDMSLHNRTIFKNIKQIPFASIIKIGHNLDVSIRRYWNYNFASVYPRNEEEAVNESYARLTSVFKNYPRDKSYLLPISGGLDSRLIAAMLKTISSSNIYCVTFGFDPHIYENVYAKRICKLLGISKHEFHLLEPTAYVNAIEPFNRAVGGSLSITHCHLFDYLNNKYDASVDYLVSGFFADAAAGYGAIPATSDLSSSAQFNVLKKRNDEFCLDCDVYDGIISDLNLLYENWRSGSTLTSFEEYVYCTERNCKLLFVLANLYRDFVQVMMPFTDYELADYLFGLPYEYRKDKIITRIILRDLFPELSMPDVSSRPVIRGLKDRMRNYHFKIINYSNILLSMISSDKFYILNPYHTELQGPCLRLHNRSLLTASIDKLLAKGIINDIQASRFRKRAYEPYQMSMQFRLITHANLFDMIN